MTHGHELRRETAGWKGGTRWRGAKGENWDNCNSIKYNNNKKKQNPGSQRLD